MSGPPAGARPPPAPQPAGGALPPSATTAWFVAILGWTALLSFYHLDGGAGFEPTDGWVAQTAREMRAGAGWRSLLVPVFSGETRLQKSPGPYWAVILTAWLRGQPDVDAVSARIPSACAAVLIVATVFWLTRRIAGDRPAVFAGWACASSVLILYWSHRAASDLGLAALTTLSLAALWVAAELEPPGRRRTVLWLGGYLAAGLGMLYKLPMPLAVVGVPALLYLLIGRRWRVLLDRVHLWGLVLFLAPWLPWAAVTVVLEPNALLRWEVEFIDRFTGTTPSVAEEQHWSRFFLYLLPPLIYCLPYSLSLPGAIWRAVRPPAGAHRGGLRFMLVWVAGLLVFFTSSAGKEVRYFLPALPPLFVLLGVELAALFDPARPHRPQRDRRLALAVWTLVPVAFLAGGWLIHRYWYLGIGRLEGFTWAEAARPYLVAAAIFTAGASLAAGLYRGRREHASFGALVATMALTWAWVWSAAMPVFASQRPYRDFAEQLRTRIPPELRPRLRQIGFQDSRVIWYSDCRFPRIIDPLELLELQGGERSREREKELIGRAMVDRLAGTEPVLLIAHRFEYIEFLREAPARLAEEGRPMPPVHLWLQTRCGPKSRHHVVFGNRPPPWPEPALSPPSRELGAASAPATAAATGPAPPPADDE